MAGLSVNTKHDQVVSDFSNSGNPIVELEQAEKKVVVAAPDGKEIEKGDLLEFTIREENHTHYVANLLTHAPSGTHHHINSEPNIPLHHDGKSASSSRSEREATDSLKDREFDPKTHNAPDLEKGKRKRKFLRSEE
jgi:phage replication-related protein YjqB (UPF0714/DUF867 family)